MMKRWWPFAAVAGLAGWWWLASHSASLPVSEAQLPWTVSEQFDLDGGLNDGSDSAVIAPNEAADLQNVVLTTSGAVKKRSGFAYVNQTAIATNAVFVGLTQYTQVDGTRFLVAAVSDDTDGLADKVYDMPYGTGTSGPTGTWTDITGALTLSFTDSQLADFVVASGSVILTDGTGSHSPYYWGGTGTLAALTCTNCTWPSATMVEFHKNVLWTAGDPVHPSVVSFSDIGDITSRYNTDFITVNQNDGQPVTALKSALDCLYVWKTASIYRVCGSDRDNYTLEQMVNGYGTLGNQSVQLIDNIFYFLDQRGEVVAYNGGIKVEVISQKANGTLNGLNPNRFAQAVSTNFNDGTGSQNYYLGVATLGSGTNNLLLQFNPSQKAWLKHVGMNTAALTTYEIGTHQPAVLFGNYSGRANQYPSGTSDAGTNITAYYQSGQYHYLQLPHEKIFRLFRAFFNQAQIATQTVTIQTFVDFQQVTSGTISIATGGSLWDAATWDSATYGDYNTVIARVEMNQIGDFFQWRLMDASTNNPFSLRGVQIWYEGTDRVGGSQ